MKRHLPGLVAAVLLAWFFPASENLSTVWRRAWSAGNITAPIVSSDGNRIAFGPLGNIPAPAEDSLPVPDPFRSEAPPPIARVPGSRTNLGVPPPPRLWKVTGRVGERAAVLTSPDGRVLVVSIGAMVDSSRVVSIATTGIVLEDRAGQFTLRIP